MKFRKVIIIAVILACFCIASFVAYKTGVNHSISQRLDHDRLYYISQFNYLLENTIYLLSTVNDWGESIHNTDASINPYRQLLSSLNAMMELNKQGLWYMRDDKDSRSLNNLLESFELIKTCIESGISFNDQQLCNDFLKDGVLSENEISFLTALKQDLVSLKNKIYDEKTKQQNQNLTIEQLSRAAKSFTDKYSVPNLQNIGLKN